MALATPILSEQKIPALILAHLVARRSDADYPTPAANALTLQAGPVKDTARHTAGPSLEVYVAQSQIRDFRNKEVLEVMIDIHAHPDTDLTDELAMLALVRRAFAGGPDHAQANHSNASTNPFMAYLNGLDSGPSAGWEVLDFHITGSQTLIDDQRRVIYRTTAECIFMSYTFTV
jgi:hypothetical protein